MGWRGVGGQVGLLSGRAASRKPWSGERLHTPLLRRQIGIEDQICSVGWGEGRR
jgi:hypothetical protein